MVCEKCGDRGIYIENGVAFQCSCNRDLAKKRRYAASRLPVKLQDYTFDGFDFCYYPEGAFPEKRKMSYREVAQSTFEAAQNFARNTILQSRGKGLFIYGNVGSGKTYLCSAIANYLLENGKEVLFIVVPDLLDEIRASYSGDSEYSEIQVLRYAINAPVLVLDDLGAHNYTEWARNKIYSIINNRLNNNMPTVINSNLNLGQIERYLGERTTSRIVELCDIYSLFVPKDIRHIKNMERQEYHC
ncbi:MAG TPA: ATP-binding protein [Clostridia bacterium]|jgi:DNA replication protein DnaC|nr:ATP-binding protein [Clostridia bacterium]